MHHGNGFGGGLPMMIIGLVFIIALIVLVFEAIKIVKEKNDKVNNTETALEVLERRYALGEITVDEFKEAKGVLKG